MTPRRRRRNRRHRHRNPRWPPRRVAVAGCGSAGWRWPPASQLYEIVKLPEAPPPPEEFGLDIGNVTFERAREGGQPVLLVGGEISNTSEIAQDVPRLRVALSDEAGEEIFHWTVTLAASELAAGQQVPFSTRLPNPPANARSLAVTFIVEP